MTALFNAGCGEIDLEEAIILLFSDESVRNLNRQILDHFGQCNRCGKAAAHIEAKRMWKWFTSNSDSAKYAKALMLQELKKDDPSSYNEIQQGLKKIAEKFKRSAIIVNKRENNKG